MEQVKRWLAWLGKGLAGVGIIASLWLAGQWLGQYVRHAPAFAIKTIHIHGNKRLNRDEILRVAGMKLGDNAFAYHGALIEKRLAHHRWIASVQASRALPDSYTLHIREHQPAAVLALDHLYLVSTEGVVFKQLSLEDPIDMPVITGVDAARFENDRHYRASTLLRVLALFQDYRDAGLWQREPIAEVHVMEDDELSVYVGKGVTYVKLGRSPYDTKLKQLKGILDRLNAQYLQASYVYLDNVRRPDRAVVKLR